MNGTQKMISLQSFFLSVLALAVWAGLISGRGTAFAADEAFSRSSAIQVPGGLTSFDISFVDPKLGLYFLADRTNKTIDQVVTKTNTISQLAAGSFVGVQSGATSGPNGVITANDHSEVWGADGVPAGGTSRVLVISLEKGPNFGKVTHTINTGGTGRSDELCEDPQHHVVMVANDEPSDLFLSFISTKTYKVIGKITLTASDPIFASNGIEQCQWSPRTRKFYLAIPEVNGPGNNSKPGAVLEINPSSMKVEKVFPIDFGIESKCFGPQGLTIGPDREILLGCSNSGADSVIINELTGDFVRNLPNLNGNDEVWYNPGDNHYFLAGSNHNELLPITGPILGVVDQRADNGSEDAAAATKSGSHSVAADPVNNQVYVPVNGANTSLCGPGSTTGCIAVFTTTTKDDPGICGEDAGGRGEPAGPVFRRFVCPGTDVDDQD